MSSFKQRLHEQRERTIHIRITALDINDHPLACFEGWTQSGSVNIDSRSAMTRTCNLSLVTQDINVNDYYWTFNQKFRLEIGLENHIDPSEEDIIWFPYGIYYITSFNCSLGVNSYSVSISGKDKLCHLDGSLGGTFGAPTDLGIMDETDANGTVTKKSIPIQQIIREMIHTYGHEPYHNIIINDLDESGLILKEYRYDKDLFLIRKVDSNDYSYADIGGNVQATYEGDIKSLADWVNDYRIRFDNLSVLTTDYTPTVFSIHGEDSYVARITYGQTAGYKETPLTYAGDLIANAGETVVSVLDKIVQMLGDFEYFYNLDGQFVFQKKKTYVNTTWSPQVGTGGESFVDPYATPLAYSFGDLSQVTTLTNTPAISEIKNDFSIWGERTSLSGAKLPIHMRYAIDAKPTSYTSITVSEDDIRAYNLRYGFNTPAQNGVTYIAGEKYDIVTENMYQYSDQVLKLSPNIFVSYSTSTQTLSLTVPQTFNEEQKTLTFDIATNVTCTCDWREIIYQMAIDYRRYGHMDDFEQRVALANSALFPTGRTGYEQYYIDMEGFWRQLYNPQPYYRKDIKNTTSYQKYAEKLYVKNGDEYVKVEDGAEFSKATVYYTKDETFYNSNNILYPWSSTVYENPQHLNFWIDFLDTQGELSKFSVKTIGQRPKVVNERGVKAIYYKETPKLIFVNDSEEKGDGKTGYRYFFEGSYYGIFSTSAQGISAKEKLDTLLYNHAVTPESISITIIPIYDLRPNTRIYINDVTSGVSGEYIINKISAPLSYNGTMNITATKCAFTTKNQATAILGEAILGITQLGTG